MDHERTSEHAIERADLRFDEWETLDLIELPERELMTGSGGGVFIGVGLCVKLDVSVGIGTGGGGGCGTKCA